MGSRYDMYNNVHKGLRSVMCSLVVDAGCSDATAAGQGPLVARWRELEAKLQAHHLHEDTFIGPHLARISPDVFAQMERAHHEVEGEIAEVCAAADAVLRRCDADSARVFYRKLASFVGHYLAHMADEEGSYTEALQAAYTDRDLLAIEGDLVASIPPAVMAGFAAVMLPALNPDERFEMLDGMRKGAPPEAFSGMRQLASQVLDAPAWQRLQAQLGA